MRQGTPSRRPMFPRVEGCILCLKSQPQPDGLLDIEGMFGLAPNATVEIEQLGIPLTQLEFIFFLGSGEGTFDLSLRVVDSGGKLLTTTELGPVEFVPAPHGHRLRFAVQPMMIQRTGRFRAILLADGREQSEARFRVALPEGAAAD
jgi:hypothetical protein